MSRASRVLILTTSYPADDDDPSGHFVRAEARELALRGSEVHVVAPGPRSPCAEERGVHVHRMGGEALFTWPGAMSRAREAPWRLVHAASFAHRARVRARELGRVDRAVAHWLVPAAWPLGGAVDGPLDAVAHGADVRLLCAMPSAMRHRVVRAVLDRSDHIRFVAGTLRDALQRALPRSLSARLVRVSSVRPVALDVPAGSLSARALRTELGVADEHAMVVTVGRLVRSKRVDLALRAARHLESAHLVVIGDGPERPSLERLASSLAGGRPARVSFLGLRPRAETVGWMRAADALLHASSAEGAPTVVREARAVGTPVVACAAGDLAAWAETDPGITISPADAAALAADLRCTLGDGVAARR